MDTIIASIVTGIFGVILMFLSNVFVDIRGYKKIDSKIGSSHNATLGGQHEDIKETLVSETRAIKTNLDNNFSGINAILNKNEGRYESLNLDQKEIRNNVMKLVTNWEELIIDNRELKQAVRELSLENDKLKSIVKKQKRELDREKGRER